MEHQNYELLKRYAKGQMSESERADFEKRLDTDAEFAADIATWATIYKGIQAEGDRQLTSRLNELGKKLMQSESAGLSATTVNMTQAKKYRIPRWAYAAAALLLLLLVAWPIYQNLQFSAPVYADSKALFEQYFQAPPAPQVRDAQVTAWRVSYENKDYPAAITQLEQLLADPNFTNRSEANLYLGISYLAAGKGRDALAALGRVNPDSFDWDDAQWYSALSFLIIDDVVQAKQTLKDISGKNGHSHQQEAQKMLDSMK